MKRKSTKAKVMVSGIIIIILIIGVFHLSGAIARTDKNDSANVATKDYPEDIETKTGQDHIQNSKEKVIYNDNGITVSYTGINKENIYLSVTNNYGKDIVFENNQIAINGIMIDSSLSQEIKNNETKQLNISYKSDISGMKLTKIQNIAINLFCTDNNNLEISEIVTIDLGNKSYKENVKLPKTEIFNQKGIRAYYKGLNKTEGLYVAEAEVVVVNDTDEIINFDVYEGKINGKETDCFASITVYPGCIGAGKIGIDGYQTEEIKSMKYTVTINDNEYNELTDSTDSQEIIVK